MRKGDLLTDLLRSVSRAFYLSLRILPAPCRTPMATAYLLARAADTIADTPQLPPSRRAEALSLYRALVQGREGSNLWGMLPVGKSDAEGILLARLPECLALLDRLSPPDLGSVRAIVETLAGGMEADLLNFPPDQEHLRALETPADLDLHTYRAAGCVGEFWTEILMRHVPALSGWPEVSMKATGVRFGKALQLVNVLRDLPGDLAEGRCYLPLSQLRQVGLEPSDLRTPGHWPRLRPIYQQWLNLALDHFRAALDYILLLPPSQIKLRLSCLWPVLIGLGTLELLSRANPLQEGRLKVSRPWIYRTLLLSLPAAPFDFLIRRWIGAMMASVESQIGGKSRPDVREVF